MAIDCPLGFTESIVFHSILFVSFIANPKLISQSQTEESFHTSEGLAQQQKRMTNI